MYERIVYLKCIDKAAAFYEKQKQERIDKFNYDHVHVESKVDALIISNLMFKLKIQYPKENNVILLLCQCPAGLSI